MQIAALESGIVGSPLSEIKGTFIGYYDVPSANAVAAAHQRVYEAQRDVAAAQQELQDAQRALADAIADSAGPFNSRNNWPPAIELLESANPFAKALDAWREDKVGWNKGRFYERTA